jgi:hypothetical protein
MKHSCEIERFQKTDNKQRVMTTTLIHGTDSFLTFARHSSRLLLRNYLGPREKGSVERIAKL